MNKETLRLLAKYNAAANEKMDLILKTLDDEAWNREFGGFFPSISALCSHIYICDYIWLKRFLVFCGKEEDGGFFAKDYNFFDPFSLAKEDYLAKRPEMDGRLSAFTAGIDETMPPRILSYVSSKGVRMEKPFGGLVLHLFNHSVHHRGMISLYLEMMGKPNDFNMISPVL